jgi:hypothetical protein
MKRPLPPLPKLSPSGLPVSISPSIHQSIHPSILIPIGGSRAVGGTTSPEIAVCCWAQSNRQPTHTPSVFVCATLYHPRERALLLFPLVVDEDESTRSNAAHTHALTAHAQQPPQLNLRLQQHTHTYIHSFTGPPSSSSSFDRHHTIISAGGSSSHQHAQPAAEARGGREPHQ